MKSRPRGLRKFRRHIKAKPEFRDGHWFSSQLELKRYGTLRMLQMAGEIRDLTVHPKLPMHVGGKKIGRGYMTLDFSYLEHFDGAWRRVYEDVKAIDTRENRLRRDICEACNGVIIRLTQSP